MVGRRSLQLAAGILALSNVQLVNGQILPGTIMYQPLTRLQDKIHLRQV